MNNAKLSSAARNCAPFLLLLLYAYIYCRYAVYQLFTTLEFAVGLAIGCGIAMLFWYFIAKPSRKRLIAVSMSLVLLLAAGIYMFDILTHLPSGPFGVGQ